MQAILQSISKPPDKRALVVSSNVQFGAGRLAELLDPNALRVFRDEDTAIAWLLEKDAANPAVKFDRTPIRTHRHRPEMSYEGRCFTFCQIL